MSDAAAFPQRLSRKKFINTAADPFLTGPKSSEAPAPGTMVTVGVFYDIGQTGGGLPFWISFQRQSSIGFCLDKLCRAANVLNTNNTARSEADKWHIFALTSACGLAMGTLLDANASIGEVAGDADIWYVGKGPAFPEGLKEEATVRIGKISSRKLAAPKPSSTAANEGSPARDSNSDIIAVTLTIPELGNKQLTLRSHVDATVAEFIAALKSVEPEVTRQGVRLMFCEKYVKNESEPIRAVPLIDGSCVDVCTGRYLSENEMTLYLADRKLQGVRSAIAAAPQPIGRNMIAYWGEQLMKALMQLDSLQDVPEDIRLRRKKGVKECMIEQDRLADMDLV